MKNLYLLPTEKPSRLRYNLSNILVLTKEYYGDYGKQVNQHIYITSDEEIKDGEWHLHYYGDKPVISKSHNNAVKVINEIAEQFGYKKIILTTDQDLINDGIQAIDDEFLKWFVKNPNCEQISVEEVYFHGSGYYKASELSEQEREKYSFMKEYKIIIPKEEDFELVSIGEETIKLAIPMIQDKEEIKQETLEEYISEVIKNFKDEMSIKFTSSGIKLGAKWQQEQNKNLYSEEDMYKLMYEYQEWLVLTLEPVKTFEEWFKQFKKK